MYLKEIEVPIPFDKAKVVIRKEKTVEMELNRSYAPEAKSTRVARKTIGQVVPFSPGKMYPNENYFALIPNDVPAEVRDSFLLKCERKRRLAEIKKDPAKAMQAALDGIQFLKEEGRKIKMENNQGIINNEPAGEEEKYWFITDAHELEYALHVFDNLYDQAQIWAEKRPDSIMSVYKVKMLNHILNELKLTMPEHKTLQILELIEEPKWEKNEKNETILTGMTNSDVLMLLVWYRNALKH